MRHDTRIVSIGGGTGLSNLLRGLKKRDVNLSVIVAVTDDGGSSGRLREELGVLPPGDIRNCMVALSEDEALMSRLFRCSRAASSVATSWCSYRTPLDDRNSSSVRQLNQPGWV